MCLCHLQTLGVYQIPCIHLGNKKDRERKSEELHRKFNGLLGQTGSHSSLNCKGCWEMQTTGFQPLFWCRSHRTAQVNGCWGFLRDKKMKQITKTKVAFLYLYFTVDRMLNLTQLSHQSWEGGRTSAFKWGSMDFFGGPVERLCLSTLQGHGFDPWLGN